MSDEPVPHIVDERLLQILQAAHEGSARDLGSEIKRLQARIPRWKKRSRYMTSRGPIWLAS